jgi:hypothetical protein
MCVWSSETKRESDKIQTVKMELLRAIKRCEIIDAVRNEDVSKELCIEAINKNGPVN